MTEKDAIELLRKLQEDYDTEAAHIDADEVLCEFLDALGYGNVVLEYNAIHKWYG